MAAVESTSSKWPDAAPPEGQQTIITISCGNTHLHWASHGINPSSPTEVAPYLFWRTPHISDNEMNNENNDDNFSPVMILSRMLPDSIHDYIFGASASDPLSNNDNATEEMALEESQKRPVEKISIYAVVSNRDQLTKLEKLCSTIPSNLVVLDGDDFFKEEQGRYHGMGVDRLAALTGAVHFHGHPALVFDGGTATTYSATNSEGMVLGGGIGPGIQSKLQSMSNDTDALPNISAVEVKERVKETVNSGQPLPTFARNTKEAMMVDVFQEFAGKGRNVIELWIKNAYLDDDKKQPPLGTKYNENRVVTCTGGDGDIFCELLQPCHGGVIEAPTGNNLKYEVRSNRHLIHYGISAILNMHMLARRKKAKINNKSGESYVGKRVAKVFDVESDDGDNIFRGSVTEEILVENDPNHNHYYRITYDDGDEEDVTLQSLKDMLKLYKQCGEKKKLLPEAKPKNGKKKAEDQSKKKADSKPQDSEAAANKSASKKHANGDAKNGKAPAAKKAKANDDIKDLVKSDPNSFVNKRVSKDFDGECFFGKVTKYDDAEPPPFWHVVYDDGDEEDFGARDLIKAVKHYKKHGKDDKNASD